MCKTHCKSNTTTLQFYGKIFYWVCLSLLSTRKGVHPLGNWGLESWPIHVAEDFVEPGSNYIWNFWEELMKYTFEIIRKKKMERSAPIKFQGPLVNKAFHQWPRLTSLQLLKHVILIAKDYSREGLQLKSCTIKNYKIFNSCLPSYSSYLEIRIKERKEKLSIGPSFLKRSIFI